MFGQKITRVKTLRCCGEKVGIWMISTCPVCHAAFVRSQYAHARITGIDASSALDMDGTVAVYALDDLQEHLTDTVMPVEQPSGALKQSASPSVLADGEVRHVGEPVAVVIAETAYGAEDAAAMVEVSYDTLAVSDVTSALWPTAHPRLTARCPTTWSPDSPCPTAMPIRRLLMLRTCWETLHQHELGFPPLNAGRCHPPPRRPRRTADRVVSNPNGAPRTIHPGRASESAGRPHSRDHAQCWRRVRRRVRLLSGRSPPSASATILLGRPVKWVEDEREHFTAATMERDFDLDLEVAVDADGRLLGVRGDMAHDHGAYTPYGVNLPAMRPPTSWDPTNCRRCLWT